MREIGRYPGERTSRLARETKLMDRFPMPAEPSLSLGMFHVEHWSNPPNPVSGLARSSGSRTNVPRGTFFLRPSAVKMKFDRDGDRETLHLWTRVEGDLQTPSIRRPRRTLSDRGLSDPS
jgi:hypothetical protein